MTFGPFQFQAAARHGLALPIVALMMAAAVPPVAAQTAAQTAAATPAANEYRLGSGDVIRVNV